MSDIDVCPNTECGSKLHWQDEKCSVCNENLPVPIQRMLLCKNEQQALDDLYLQAKLKADKIGCGLEFKQLEQQIANDSCAVINIPFNILSPIIKKNDNAYTNYHLQVNSHMRKPATIKEDKQRTMVDAAFFGSLASKIVFAALSLNQLGLPSYGGCSVAIKNITMKNRATVAWENSFHFFEHHKQELADFEFPPGYRAIWDERHKLAMAKLVDKLIANPNYDDAHQFIMNSNGDRETDEFIEVHIYDVVAVKAFERIAVPEPSKPENEIADVDFCAMRDLATSYGCEVVTI